MGSLDKVKAMVMAYIVKRRRVKLSELKEWAISNDVGLAVLYIVISQIIKERKDIIQGKSEPLIDWHVELLGSVTGLEAPGELSLVEPRRKATQRGSERRVRGQRTLMEVLGELKGEEEPKQVQSVEKPKEATAEVQEAQSPKTIVTENVVEKPVENPPSTQEARPIEKPGEAPEAKVGQVEEGGLSLQALAGIVARELSISVDDATRLIVQMGQYLNRYWSVGLIRLIEDLSSKGINPGLINRALKVLENLGYVTVVNPPGVVNKPPNVKFPVPETKIGDLVKG